LMPRDLADELKKAEAPTAQEGTEAK